jgi:predicted enzyme related to lactoylglutathione lyase
MNGIAHIEIPCTDLEKVSKFYEAVFGWKTMMVPNMDYALFEAPAGINGGYSKQLKITPEPGAMLYMEVEDINATLRKIGDSGGRTITEKTQIGPEYGYMAIFSDVEGNTMGLWSKS